MRKVISFLFLLTFMMMVSAGPIPPNTGIIAEDCDGKTWDFDALLQAGKHIVVHQTFSG